MERVSERLEENQRYLQGQFENAMDFMMRELELSGTKAALFALDGLVSKQTITLSVLNPLMEAGEMGLHVSYFPISGTWIDIGSPTDFAHARELMRHQLESD